MPWFSAAAIGGHIIRSREQSQRRAAPLSSRPVSIDLNADLGEGFDDVDRALLGIVTSANVACGFHAGGESIGRELCRAAAAHGIAVGAHIGYRDREGFGRRELGVPAATLRAEAAEQIEALSSWAEPAGVRVAYVKPHGALYHRASSDSACAAAIVEAALGAGGLGVLAFPGSELLEQAHEAGLQAVAEGFADRGYLPDGWLVPRGEPGAVLDEESAALQALELASEGSVGSLCVHGDTPEAAALARHVRERLETAGVEVRAFT
jgi:UPF0271 protein